MFTIKNASIFTLEHKHFEVFISLPKTSFSGVLLGKKTNVSFDLWPNTLSPTLK
jgi:hypothetical protein